MTGESASPFNVRDAIQVRWFTLSEVEQLFNDFAADRELAVDPAIPKDIHDLTAGYIILVSLLSVFSSCRHAGLVNLCGRAMDGRWTGNLSYKSWLEYATFQLQGDVLQWPTMAKMVATLQRKDGDVPVMRSLLARRFLPNMGGIVLSDPVEEALAKFLAAEGALLYDSAANSFQVRFVSPYSSYVLLRSNWP